LDFALLLLDPPLSQKAPLWQGLSHWPQCSLENLVSTQRPLQKSKPWGHWQLPPVQTWPPVQALLQAPQ